MGPVVLSMKMSFLEIWNKKVKRGGAGNLVGENAVFGDMKQKVEKGWSRYPCRCRNGKISFLKI